jgi:hypothetical protein
VDAETGFWLRSEKPSGEVNGSEIRDKSQEIRDKSQEIRDKGQEIKDKR